MFTLEIADKAVAITDADEEQARDLFESQDFKDDLRSMESEGRPLWDGAAALHVRPSTEGEIDAFDEILNEDEGDASDEEDGINVLFLVPVDNLDGDAAAAN